VSEGWSIGGTLRALRERGEATALLLFGKAQPEGWDAATLGRTAQDLARGLRAAGVARGVAVGLWAENGAPWVIAALAVLAAGGVLVPVDDLADAAQASALLRAGGARLLFTTGRHAAELGENAPPRLVLLDASEAEPGGWRALLRTGGEVLPDPAPEDPALLLATSGTTGAPKAFLLTHRNVGTNVAALARLGIVNADDRALLPLPLHHAYPFVVGLLTPLAIGTQIVLPGGATGPLILQALRQSGATAIVGVPRLYEAMLGAIEARLAASALPVRLVLGCLLRLAGWLRRRTGRPAGRLLLAPLRRAVAPRLRLLVSGGARLEPAAEARLEALGWLVLTGYGLAETASLFTGNRPAERRAGSAGRPLGGGAVRIAAPDAEGSGEIELRGPSVTAGYIDNPQADRAAFTADGWFRTGDLGRLDADGFLWVTGRAKEVLVLGGGKKVDPEAVERAYGAAPEIAEIAVLERDAALVALVRPDSARLRAMGATNLRDGVRVVLGERGQRLPSYQRLAGFALTDRPLPRTRLGKLRRFLLPQLYESALAGGAGRTPRPPTAADLALLQDPTAAGIWAALQQRWPEQATDLDIDPSLDLNLDSFGWMELTMMLEERFGVRLAESDLAGIATVRDLLRLAVARRGAPAAAPAEAMLDPGRWLAPTAPLLTVAGAALHLAARLAMRLFFRLRVTGLEHLPASGAFVIMPNHGSYLDPLAIAAALPLRQLRRLYWAGDINLLFRSPARRLFCRAVHLFPVDGAHPTAAIETGAAVLSAGRALVWFPEGWRSPDGRLQRFMPGIGQLVARSGAAVVPAWIDGAFTALPRGRRRPRLARITVAFGPPAPAEALAAEGGGPPEARIAAAARARLLATGRAIGAPDAIEPDAGG
jgi:long-chain acyl-CoA synthetase